MMELDKYKRLFSRWINCIFIPLLLHACGFGPGTGVSSIEQPAMTLWYGEPATNWMTSALPIGNGELGSMFFGGVEKEQIQFNEKTLWKGSPALRGAYQSFGDIFLEFPGHASHTGYRRELSLDDAIGRVSYSVDSVQYVREYFVSHPEDMLVVRITTPENSGKITLLVNMDTEHKVEKNIEANQIIFAGKLDILSFEARLAVINEGGILVSDNNKISVSGADAITLLLTAATNFDIESDSYIGLTAEEVHQKLAGLISRAATKTYDELKNTHLTDYQPRFDRVALSLNTPMPDMPTDELIRSHRDNLYLDMLYFQYGRYLMLASSRGMYLPNNLQGIWNDNNNPPWQCDIHSNINIQMNYWPAESANLSECHLPFIHYVKTEALRKGGSWQQLALSERNRGWTIKTQSNIFGYTDWNINRPANAWYCMHLWQHYAYTHDREYLRQTAYPVMQEACRYWFDRLKEDANGRLIAPDEWSPEQGPWEDNVAYAQQLIWELFDQTIQASEVLTVEDAFVTELKDKFDLLDNGISIGEWGQIKEWTYDTARLDTLGNEHRHLSQLIALYPGNQISYLTDSISAAAAKTTLNSRGDMGTGWSRAWKIACWARLFEGDQAYKLLKTALNPASITVISMNNNDGGVYENLLDAHPPFQIDGNFGATAGIAEMLVQTHRNEIHLLPALPRAWSAGSVKGLKATGNFEVSISWKNNRLMRAEIISNSGIPCVLRTNIPVKVNGITLNGIQEGDYYVYRFETQRGEKYLIKPAQ